LCGSVEEKFMAISYWCILIAGLLPTITVGIAKGGSKDFDNSNPRRWLEKQKGLRARADAAHRNHFEAFPFFAAGVLVAQLCQAPQDMIDLLAVTFITLRIAYTFMYLTDRATLRTVCWMLGMLTVVGQFIVATIYG
jgi:uncharacterized MAPEG superfamily protein